MSRCGWSFFLFSVPPSGTSRGLRVRPVLSLPNISLKLTHSLCFLLSTGFRSTIDTWPKDDGPLERKAHLRAGKDPRDEKRERVPRGLNHARRLLLVLLVTTRNAVSTPFSLSLSFLSGSHDLYASEREKERERDVSARRTDVLRNVVVLRNDDVAC